MNFEAVETWLQQLQSQCCEAFSATASEAPFYTDAWQRQGAGGGITRVLENGVNLEKAAVNFSSVHGDALPAAASAARPTLAGRHFRATGISVIVHPRNPFAPISHANLRLFIAEKAGAAPLWWFGGGFDLTPCYGFEEDCRHWHQTAHDACERFGEELYPKFKRCCDDYFYIKHRDEMRGIGGLFFDDFDAGGDFERAFAFVRSVGEAYPKAYLPILKRRMHTAWGQRERDFQLYRRGRYVEFNLVYDRGTLFGLQSGGRTESILASLPPEVRYRYNWKPEPGSPEARLSEYYLQPHDWL